MNRNLVLGIGMGAFALVAAAMALRGALTASLSVAAAKRSSGRCEIYAKLDRDSIRALNGAVEVSFKVRDPDSGEEMTVLYSNPSAGLSANFPAADYVRAAGIYDPVAQQFVSDRVQTKCPSKYEGKQLDMSRQTAVDKWQSEIKTAGDAGSPLTPAAFDRS